MAVNVLEIQNLTASVIDESGGGEKQILNGVNLNIAKGEIHILMGTNGSGKSTLAYTLMGHPRYQLKSGKILFKGADISNAPVNERAQKGLFLAFQYPTAIQGLSVASFLKSAVEAVRGESIPIKTFRKELTAAMEELSIPREFLKRSLNEGFSGGEKKRNEILQMKMLKPALALLDETDSGLDVDALKLVFDNVKKTASEENAFLIITHYNKVLEYLNPTHVHIMREGTIVKSGDIALARQIEREGFEKTVNG